MYIGNPGSTVSSGIAYALTAKDTTLENFYFFFDAARDLSEPAVRTRWTGRRWPARPARSLR